MNGIPVDDWGFMAYMGFRKMGLDIHFFEDIEEVPISNLVVAYIEDTIKYFNRCGILIPTPLNIPEELNQPYLLKRRVEVKTIEEFKSDTELPIFIKPYSKVKQFVSGVIHKQDSRLTFFNDLENDTLVLISEYISIASEYRGFVIDGKLESLNHYSGDFRLYPDTKVIEYAINLYKSAPAGYSIDFGVTTDNKTILIECNDGWSLGSYGCDPIIYSRLLLKRWREIFK